MKKFFLLSCVIALSLGSIAQGNSKNKSNGKAHTKSNAGKKEIHTDQQGHAPASQYETGKSSKNQPSKVRAAFQQDYPNAANVKWSKLRGDWTATFNNGVTTSTAVYHANGQRKDTRTVIGVNQLPGTFWDRIFKRDRVTPVGVVQIQPSVGSELFRIASQYAGSKLQYMFYNANGQKVKYNY